LLDTLVALNAASAAPLVVDFDLTNAIQSASLDLIDTGARVAFGRADAVPVTGDVRLISLAVVNCLRNAIESAARSPRPELPVVINWGETDRDYWIAILDEGDGLPIGADHLLAPGITTKNDDGLHFGIGLTIAQRAMHSLEGDVDLRPREGFGAVAELRWPRRP
jgi:signal transduction histidine kinase